MALENLASKRVKQEIILLTTSGCHLCEQVEAMLAFAFSENTSINEDFNLKLVEIAENDQLIEQYGIRIPVLKVAELELGFPFDYQQMLFWLKDISSKTKKGS